MEQDISVTAKTARTKATVRSSKQAAVDAELKNATDNLAATQTKIDSIADVSDMAIKEKDMMSDGKTIKTANSATYLASYVDQVIADTLTAYGNVVNAKTSANAQMKLATDAKTAFLDLSKSVATGAKDADTQESVETFVDGQKTILDNATKKAMDFATNAPASPGNPFADSCFIDSTECNMTL